MSPPCAASMLTQLCLNRTNVSVGPAATKGPSTKVLLKPPVMDLELSTNPTSEKTSSWLRPRDKSPARAANAQPSDHNGEGCGCFNYQG